MQLKHLVITRFSYRGKNLHHFFGAASSNSNEDPLTPIRLELRLKLFELVCLPSVKAQTEQQFAWIIIVDKDLPSSFRSRLERLIEDRSNFVLHTFELEERLDQLDWLGHYIDNAPDFVITTILDDDDALPNNFVSATRKHVSSTFEAGKLPPLKILGVDEIIQWDMITSPKAPLGWCSPWQRGKRTSSCGFSLVAKYPQFSFCVIGLRHVHAEHYFDFATPAKTSDVAASRDAFVAVGLDANDQLDKYPASSMFHNLVTETGPVLMSNHTNNAQKWRLYEGKAGQRPVTGQETFPNLTVDLERFAEYSMDFREGLFDRLKLVVGSYSSVDAIKRRIKLMLFGDR